MRRYEIRSDSRAEGFVDKAGVSDGGEGGDGLWSKFSRIGGKKERGRELCEVGSLYLRQVKAEGKLDRQLSSRTA